MKYDVSVDRLGERPIRLEVIDDSEAPAVRHSHDEGAVITRASAEEAFALGLELIQRAAQVGVRYRPANAAQE